MRLNFFINIFLILIISSYAKNVRVNEILDSMEGKPQKEIFKVFHYLYEKKYNINSEEALKRYRIFK